MAEPLLPLTMLVQACEGFGLASMGTPVVQLTVVFEIYIYGFQACELVVKHLSDYFATIACYGNITQKRAVYEVLRGNVTTSGSNKITTGLTRGLSRASPLV